MVLLNNLNIEDKFNCKIIEFNPDATKFASIASYWPKYALQPVRVKSRERTFRNLNVKILFYGDYETTLENISKFIEESKESTFKYFNKYYDVSISEGDNKENLINSNTKKIELEYEILNCYEDEKIITTNTSISLIINSPKSCYANLELRANTNAISCIVKINDTEITVRNIKGNETIYIGSGKVVAGGKSKINDVDIWEFPKLNPGVNNISINREDVSLTVKYCERW
ncbi:hypothetical protein H8697_00865 [[Eubacterium] tenue]|nr:hypothetical protein [[Eubacterium] tenue]MBC8630261.1 hypothetical protein [[Eubacterium] tenue]